MTMTIGRSDMTAIDPSHAGRPAVVEDLNFDPTYQRFRIIASALLGVAINGARRSGFFSDPLEPHEIAKAMDQVERLAVEHGVIVFDKFHHAPMCPANHFHRKRMPTGPCTCGAEAAGLLSRDA